MERKFTWEKSGRTRQIKFYIKLTHRLCRFYGVVPFGYKIGKEEPDQIVEFHQHPIFNHLSLLYALVMDLFIVHEFIEIVFGQMTEVEVYVLLAMNSVYLSMSTAQWCYVLKFYRIGGLNLCNFILNLQHGPFFLDPPFLHTKEVTNLLRLPPVFWRE